MLFSACIEVSFLFFCSFFFIEYMDSRKKPVPAFVSLGVIACFHVQKKGKSLNKLSTVMTLMLVKLVGKEPCFAGEKELRCMFVFVCDNAFCKFAF